MTAHHHYSATFSGSLISNNASQPWRPFERNSMQVVPDLGVALSKAHQFACGLIRSAVGISVVPAAYRLATSELRLADRPW